MNKIRIVTKMRTLYWCEVCHQLIEQPHIYFYGGYPKPVGSHICLTCAQLEGIVKPIRLAATSYLASLANHSPTTLTVKTGVK